MAKAKKNTQQTFTKNGSSTPAVAPKANNVTASTATKNISSTPAVAPKANNVTAATATKNVSPSAPVTAKYTEPSTPAVSTPTYTAPSTPSYTAPSTPSYVAPSNPTPTVVSPTNGVVSMDNYSPILGDNYDVTKGEDLSSGLPSIQDVLTSIPNESPAEKTRRWLGNMGILGNANSHAARNNVIRNNASSNLQRSLEDSVRDTLLGENGLYEEVPNVGGGSVFDAILNPSAVIPKENTGKSALEESLSRAAASALDNAGLVTGNGTTPGTVFQQILDPEKYAQLPNPGTSDIDLYNNISTGDATSGGSGGGSRGGSDGGSTSGLAGGYNLDDLYDLINRQLAEYDNGYNTLMQNLLNAYNANFGSLNDSYLAALQALGLNYADTENLLNGRLANSQQSLEDARKRAMQEAYISRMMDQKNLEDYLGAAGLSGGATESVLNSIMNNYRNNRNKIEENTQTSLRELLQSYLDNMSNARQAYNSGILNAENNRMSAAQNLANSLYESQASAASNYSNQRANVYNNLYDTLAKLALKG